MERDPTRAVTLHLSSRRNLKRLERVQQAVHDGVWLGLSDDELVHRIDQVHYDREGQYVDEGYNRRGLWDWERAAVDRYFAGRNRLAVPGAGGGREVLALLQRGHDAWGFECNEKMARFGNELLAAEGWPDRIRVAPRDVWPDRTGSYDGVMVGWGSYMMMRGRDRRITFLRQARATLPEGGPILVSFFARKGASAYYRLVAAIGSTLRRARHRDRLELGDALAPNYVHFFTEEQVGDELAAAGFEMVSYETARHGRAVGLSRP